MRNTSVVVCAILSISSIILLAHQITGIEVRANTAYAFAAIPSPTIVESINFRGSSFEDATSTVVLIPEQVPSAVEIAPQHIPTGTAGLPLRVIAPSIGLDSPIQNVGV